MEEKRYIRIAYIGKIGDEPNGTYWIEEEGSRTFAEIFKMRPVWARFAVLQDDTLYLCVDLDETMYLIDAQRYQMHPPLIYPTMDAAIMAAQMKL